MAAEQLEGAFATLVRVGTEKLDVLYQRVKHDEAFRLTIALKGPPELEDLRSRLEADRLLVWEIHPGGAGAATGYAGVVMYSGPPFVFVYLEDHQRDLEVARDATLQIVKRQFQTTKLPELWMYHDKPVDESVHALMIEGGFDVWDDALPGIDQNEEAAYVIERHTFDVYYGEGFEEEELEP